MLLKRHSKLESSAILSLKGIVYSALGINYFIPTIILRINFQNLMVTYKKYQGYGCSLLYIANVAIVIGSITTQSSFLVYIR